MEVQWLPTKFKIPAMQIAVMTIVDGKKKKKRNDLGALIYDSRIIPKGRPRRDYNPKTNSYVTHNPQSTKDFEKWIRNKFFDEYPGSFAIMHHGVPHPVDEYFMGCQWFGEAKPCIRFRQGPDFIECQVCPYRRKNLIMDMSIFLKDERHLDSDNVRKIVQDSLNGVCFYDDLQIIGGQTNLYFNAAEEAILVTMSVKELLFDCGTLVGGYSIKKMPIREALNYIKFIVNKGIIAEEQYDLFLTHLKRADTRSYIKQLNIESLKGFKNA